MPVSFASDQSTSLICLAEKDKAESCLSYLSWSFVYIWHHASQNITLVIFLIVGHNIAQKNISPRRQQKFTCFMPKSSSDQTESLQGNGENYASPPPTAESTVKRFSNVYTLSRKSSECQEEPAAIWTKCLELILVELNHYYNRLLLKIESSEYWGTRMYSGMYHAKENWRQFTGKILSDFIFRVLGCLVRQMCRVS